MNTEPNPDDPFDLAGHLADLPPEDLVPDNPVDLPAPGTEVAVVIAGTIVTDPDGLPVGMTPNQRRSATITETRGVAFWDVESA